jgi:hypothetical protein
VPSNLLTDLQCHGNPPLAVKFEPNRRCADARTIVNDHSGFNGTGARLRVPDAFDARGASTWSRTNDAVCESDPPIERHVDVRFQPVTQMANWAVAEQGFDCVNDDRSDDVLRGSSVWWQRLREGIFLLRP